jgi:hypothetical protein|tara:strand:- start:113 stop:313 length:201 start_codon:yes stop_codon:yes gene_type:complete
MPKEQTLEDWVSDMTVAHNNHAKAIEVLELRERGLHETNEAQASEITDLRKAVNTLLTHLELTLEG